MGIFGGLFGGREQRGEVPAGSVPISSSNLLELITGLSGWASESGISVNIESALGVPAVGAAVNFLSGTMASLPLDHFRVRGGQLIKQTGGLADILGEAINDETTSFEWRAHKFQQVFTGGRGLTFIERAPTNRVINLWPLDPTRVTIKRQGGRKSYEYQDGGKRIIYEAREIIDITFALKADALGHRSPIRCNSDVIGLAIAATQYGSKFFQNGGVPPFAVTGSFQSGGAMQRAADDMQDAIRTAAKEKRQVLVLPQGLEIKSIGVDAQKSQFVELKRLLIEEIARIYSMPPVFLQDLTHGTFTNTEQQDLHFVKHTLRRWVKQFEQELNLKLFGRAAGRRQYVKLNIDGLLRGDFMTRMQGHAQAVQNSVLTPNEARRMESLPADPAGDRLMIQGATVPLASQLNAQQQENQPNADDDA